ncbi:unnamed protein product [Closterium sp. NIES-53]
MAPSWTASCPPVLFPASSLAFLLTRLGGSFTTPPRAVFCPPRTSPLTSVSQVDAVEPVEVVVDSGAARGAEPAGAGSGGAESRGAEPGGAGSGGAEPRGAESRGAEPGGAEPRGAESGGAGSARVASHSAFCAAGAGGPAVTTSLGGARTGSTGAAGTEGAAEAAGVRPAGGSIGAAGGTGAAGPTGVGAAGVSGATGAGATGGVSAGGSADASQSAGTGVGAVGAGGAAGAGAAAGGTGAVPAGSGDPARPRPYFVPLLEQVLRLPPSTGPAPPLECPQSVPSQSQLQPVSPLPSPAPYTGPTGGLAERREHASRPVLPVRVARTSGRAPRQHPPAVPGTHQMALRPSTTLQHVPLPSPPVSSLPVLADPTSDSLRAASPTDASLLSTVVTDPSFESVAASALVAELVDFAARYRLDYAASLVAESVLSVLRPSGCFAPALPHLVSMLIAPKGDPDAPDIPTPRSYAEAIEGPYSSQWQSAMDAEMASWKSTGTYVDEVPPPGANIVSGMWIFRGVDYFQTFSPTPKMTTLRVLLHVAAQRDYELHSLDFSTAFLQGSLHEEIWLRRPPGFTGSFPPGTQWSLRRPVYGLRQAPREWHDTLRTTLAALGFAPSTANPSLFLRTDTSLPPFYILVYVDDLVFATADTAGLAHVLQRFAFTYSSPQATPLSTRHSLSALPSDESVEPSGPYPELVGCLMYLMTCTRPDLAYPLSILTRYVAPGRHRPEHMAAAKRVLRYLYSTSGLGLVLGGRRPVVLTGHADASWADDQATQRSSQGYTFSLGSGSVSWRSTRSSSVLGSSCEAEIYAGAMAAQELRWLTYLLTDLGEPPRSPPVLYVDNKAMLALCREHRLEHRTKHIALRYFFARELQQRGQLRFAYVVSQANIAYIFTKALPLGDHQRFCTMLSLLALLCLTGLVTSCSPPLCIWGVHRRRGGMAGSGEHGGGNPRNPGGRGERAEQMRAENGCHADGECALGERGEAAGATVQAGSAHADRQRGEEPAAASSDAPNGWLVLDGERKATGSSGVAEAGRHRSSSLGDSPQQVDDEFAEPYQFAQSLVSLSHNPDSPVISNCATCGLHGPPGSCACAPLTPLRQRGAAAAGSGGRDYCDVPQLKLESGGTADAQVAQSARIRVTTAAVAGGEAVQERGEKCMAHSQQQQQRALRFASSVDVRRIAAGGSSDKLANGARAEGGESRAQQQVAQKAWAEGFDAIERGLVAAVKGFAIGAGLRGGLSLFSLLGRLRRRRARVASTCRGDKDAAAAGVWEGVVGVVREGVRYGMFVGTFAGSYCVLDEGIAAVGGHDKTRRWRALLAGAAAAPSLLLAGPNTRHTSLALYVLLRSVVLAVRCGIKSPSWGWLFRPLTWRHGDTLLMCISAAQILLVPPPALPSARPPLCPPSPLPALPFASRPPALSPLCT